MKEKAKESCLQICLLSRLSSRGRVQIPEAILPQVFWEPESSLFLVPDEEKGQGRIPLYGENAAQAFSTLPEMLEAQPKVDWHFY